MKFDVKVQIFDKVINLKGVEAQSEFEAENKAKTIINKRIKFNAKLVPEKDFVTDYFEKNIFNKK